MRSRSRGRGPLMTVIGVVIVAVMLFPVYWMANAAFQPSTALLRTPPSWFPAHGTLAGFRTAFSQQLGHLGTSLVVGLGTVVLTLVIAAPAGYALAQLRVRFAGAVVFAIALVQMLPGIMMANAIYEAFTSLHLLNSRVGLILADSSLAVPFAILVLRTAMLRIPRELSEASFVDGAGLFRTFRSVILPLSRNALITAGLFSIYQYIGQHATDWNAVMASSLLAALPAAVLLVVAQRFVAAGISSGSVKE
jgi:multiple sugar transport system permease protein